MEWEPLFFNGTIDDAVQVVYLGFRCDENVYTSVRGRQEARPRGPPMAHMDSTNVGHNYDGRTQLSW